jgi:arginase family enzyme
MDYGDVSVIPTSIEHSMKAITETASKVLEAGSTLISLGGDHSIALPLLRAHAQKYGPLSLVHVDAHIDTWEAEFEAVPYSHGTPFRYALQEGLIRKGRVCADRHPRPGQQRARLRRCRRTGRAHHHHP